ncbi:mCG146080, partial [Mus musculus]
FPDVLLYIHSMIKASLENFSFRFSFLKCIFKSCTSVCAMNQLPDIG